MIYSGNRWYVTYTHLSVPKLADKLLVVWKWLEADIGCLHPIIVSTIRKHSLWHCTQNIFIALSWYWKCGMKMNLTISNYRPTIPWPPYFRTVPSSYRGIIVYGLLGVKFTCIYYCHSNSELCPIGHKYLISIKEFVTGLILTRCVHHVRVSVQRVFS